MNTFATIEEAQRFNLVTYYTIRLEVNEKKENENEFEKWILKHSRDESVKDEYQDIMALLERMGQELSAKLRYFRHEGRQRHFPRIGIN